LPGVSAGEYIAARRIGEGEMTRQLLAILIGIVLAIAFLQRPIVVGQEPAKAAAPIDPAKALRISVFNAAGTKAIAEFRVIAGVPAGSVSGAFEQRTGQSVVNWQPHTTRLGKDGELFWPLARAYDEMALRVEAAGYQPQVWAWLRKAEGPKHLVFQLADDPGVPGRALLPDGTPAAGATVALALAQRDAVWEDGKLRGQGEPLPEKPGDRWRRPLLVTTDAEGRFQLPTETEPAAILIIHDAGAAELSYAEFQKSPEVKLQGWGRIEGRVLWKDKPGVDEPIRLSIHRDDYGYPGMIASYARANTDAEGRFAFDRVLPGHAQLSRPIVLPATEKSGISEANLDGLYRHFEVRAGEPTAVVLGGQGRKVTGRLTGRDSWDGVTFHFHPEAPHFGFAGDDAMWRAFGLFRASPIGPIYFRDKQKVNADGTFTIDAMLPGRYQWFVSAPGAREYVASRVVTVEPETPGEMPLPLDLGQIAVSPPPLPAEEPDP
jgi:hypothetical protein